MFRLKQTLLAQRRLEALLQGRRSRRKDRRAGDPLPLRPSDGRKGPSPDDTPFLARRRRRQWREVA